MGGKIPGDDVEEPSRKSRLSLGWSGKGCCQFCEFKRKKLSCFRAFDTNLPVLDVQIMGGGAGWREAGSGQKKGNRGRDRCGKFKSPSSSSSSLVDKRGLCLNIFFRSWPSLFQAFRTDAGTGYSLALN